MNKAVFLDRDGTINVDTGYVYKYEDFHYIDGVIESLKMFTDCGYKIVIVTNQSGIARGYYTEEDFLKLHRMIDKDLKDKGIIVSGLYYCKHLNGCQCRKPKTFLFKKAAEELDIDFGSSYAIGDRMRDLQICMEKGVKGYLIDSSYSQEEAIPENIKVVSSMLEAAKEICKNESCNEN